MSRLVNKEEQGIRGSFCKKEFLLLTLLLDKSELFNIDYIQYTIKKKKKTFFLLSVGGHKTCRAVPCAALGLCLIMCYIHTYRLQ